MLQHYDILKKKGYTHWVYLGSNTNSKDVYYVTSFKFPEQYSFEDIKNVKGYALQYYKQGHAQFSIHLPIKTFNKNPTKIPNGSFFDLIVLYHVEFLNRKK